MFYGNSVSDTRKVFFDSWHKYRHKQPLLALEQQLVDVILAHPEYHSLLEKDNAPIEQAYFPELGQTNPFLHMGLHLAIREQIATNRPAGIADVFQRLIQQGINSLEVEHKMLDLLAECLWEAQRYQAAPDEQHYLTKLQNLLND